LDGKYFDIQWEHSSIEEILDSIDYFNSKEEYGIHFNSYLFNFYFQHKGTSKIEKEKLLLTHLF